MAQNALASLFPRGGWNFGVADASNFLMPIQQGIEAGYRDRQQAFENNQAQKRMGFEEQRLGMQREQLNQAQKRMGFEEQRLEMQREQFNDQKAQRVKERVGNLALLTLQEQDEQRRVQKWNQFLATHPDASNLDPKYRDANTGPMAALAEAGMAQQYLEYQMKKAAEARANDSLSIQRNQDARAEATHTAQLAQYQNMAPADRAKAASFLGLQPGTTEYNAFIASGQYNASSDGIRSVKEGEALIRVPKLPGQKPEVIYGEQQSGADRKFAESAATKQADRFNDAVSQGNTQNAAMGEISTLRQLSDRIGQPGVRNTMTQVFGPTLRGMGLAPERLSDMEAFTALISRLVPSQRPPGSGTMSDKDVELFRQSLPQLSATAEGRKFILDQMESIAQYDRARAAIATEAINGRITRQQAETYLQQIPDPMALFRQRAGRGTPARSTGQGPQPGTVEDGYRFTGGDPAKRENWVPVR